VLVLVRETTHYGNTPSLENLVTASLQVDVVAIPVATVGQNQSWTFTANGPGFSQAEARKAAEERIIKQISSDTRISYNQISPTGR
jgi:uncharacterized lipoprotein YehR (DUF1307 family)